MRLRTLLAVAGAAAVVACSNTNLLPIASVANTVDTVTLGAIRSTPVGTPSAYSVALTNAIRTDIPGSPIPDFIYDIDSVAGPALIPAEAAKMLPHSATNPGLRPKSVPFDSIKTADLNGYTTDSLVPVDSGNVLEVRSLISCAQGVPLYAKLQVLGIDSVAHTVTFQILVDGNCGYRGLQPGLPQH
jgi:hypothetical protein